MTKTTMILRNISTLALVTASATIPAAAATLPHFASFFHSSRPGVAKAAKPEYVTMAFRNAALQVRELQVGSEHYRMAAGSKLRLRVSVGSPVLVSSEVNSRIGGVVATATTAAAGDEVVVR